MTKLTHSGQNAPAFFVLISGKVDLFKVLRGTGKAYDSVRVVPATCGTFFACFS